MDFQLFMSLDDGVIDDILSSWLTLQDLALGLDIALTHAPSRETYLKHLYNASITLHQPITIQPIPEISGGVDSDNRGVVKKNQKKTQTIEQQEQPQHKTEDVLYWLYHRNFAIEQIEFQRSIQMKDLQHIDQRMVDRIEQLSFTADTITELDIQCIAKCKNLKRLTLDCWVNSAIKDEHIDIITKNCVSLESLELIQCQSITIKSLLSIQQNVKRLQRLKLQLCSNIHFQDITQFLQVLGWIPELSMIDSISFQHIPPVTRGTGSSSSLDTTGLYPKVTSLHLPLYPLSPIASSCPNVQKLTVVIGEEHATDNDRAYSLYQEYLIQIANTLTNLTEVAIINRCKNFDPIVFFSSINQSREKLKKLVVEGNTDCVSAPLMASILHTFPHLTSLTLHNTAYVRESEQNLNAMDDGNDEDDDMNETEPAIQEEIVLDNDVMRDIGFETEESNGALPVRESLVELELININKFSDYGLQRLPLLFPKLEILNLTMCNNISERGLLLFSKLLSSLKHLYLSSCDNVNSEAAINFLQSNHNLQELDLSRCSSLSDDLLLYIVNHDLPSLKRLDISMKSGISLKAIQHIMEKRYSHERLRLTHLYVDYLEHKEADSLRNKLRTLTKAAHLREPIIQLHLSV